MIKRILPLLFLLLLTTPVRASGIFEAARLGVLAQGWGGPGASREQGAAINLEAVFTSPEFLSAVGGPRPVVGATIATDDEATSQIYTGLEWTFDFSEKIFLNALGGIAIHNGETKFDPIVDAPRIGDTVFYGCRVLFRLSGDLGYRLNDDLAVSLHASHISNAGLCEVNEGLDQVGVRLTYQF